MFKKILISILLFFAVLAAPGGVLAADDVTVYLFRGDGCPHCAKEEIFLEKLKLK
jgi:hypothetical protein